MAAAYKMAADDKMVVCIGQVVVDKTFEQICSYNHSGGI